MAIKHTIKKNASYYLTLTVVEWADVFTRKNHKDAIIESLELFNEKFTWEKINYIHNNPVSEGFVNKPENWRYSSASNYNQETSLIPEVYCLPGRLITL